MKLFKLVLIFLVLLVNLAIAQPSWADPVLTQTPDYTEVTQAITDLIKIKQDPNQTDLKPEEIEQQLGNLKLQKYILETATDWAQCRNETGNTLAVYAHKAKKMGAPQLYFLANGQSTDDDWNCDGVYLPGGTKIAGLLPGEPKALTQPVAFKIVSGSHFIAKSNPNTSAVEFNLFPAKVFKAGKGDWSIPDLSAADIAAKVPNAPIED